MSDDEIQYKYVKGKGWVYDQVANRKPSSEDRTIANPLNGIFENIANAPEIAPYPSPRFNIPLQNIPIPRQSTTVGTSVHIREAARPANFGTTYYTIDDPLYNYLWSGIASVERTCLSISGVEEVNVEVQIGHVVVEVREITHNTPSANATAEEAAIIFQVEQALRDIAPTGISVRVVNRTPLARFQAGIQRLQCTLGDYIGSPIRNAPPMRDIHLLVRECLEQESFTRDELEGVRVRGVEHSPHRQSFNVMFSLNARSYHSQRDDRYIRHTPAQNFVMVVNIP